jgi:RNA polymerase sigma-70 factor (sigma-E family)
VDLLRRSRTRADFERFAAAQADTLLRTAYLIAGDRSEAEDLVQECLLRLARRWPKVRSMDHPGAYARRVLVNLALDGRLKRSRRYVELQGSDGQASPLGPDRTIVRLEAHADLLAALADLPVQQRAVLVLRYYLDLPENEIAAVLDCPPGTVKSSASRGLQRLRATLEGSSAEAAEPKPPNARRAIR